MTTGDIANVDTAANLAGMLSLFKGKSSTTTNNTSPQGINALVQQALAGTQGLAAVSSGARSAGVYNSSTQQLMTNDLLTRISGEAAARSGGTTTTQKAPLQLQDLLTMYAMGKGKKGLDSIWSAMFPEAPDMGLAGIGSATSASGTAVGAGSASLDSLAEGGLSAYAGASAAGLDAAGTAAGIGGAAAGVDLAAVATESSETWLPEVLALFGL